MNGATVTHLCAPIFVDDLQTARLDMLLAAEAGADMLELRIDRWLLPEVPTAGQVAQLVKAAPLPVIVTCRPTCEGGQSDLTTEQRMQVLQHAVNAGATYVDVELDTAHKATADFVSGRSRENQGGLILSSHDFAGRPARLATLTEELFRSHADIVKLVWQARTVRDNLEAFEILQHRAKPAIVLCMGEAGLISRVLAKKFGAFLTFASLRTESGTAPGQVTLTDMKRLYRWDALGSHTRVYGVVGSPIAHSMSPAIHNAAFDAIGFDGLYLPLLLNPGYESFKAFMESFLAAPGLDLAGLSITIPHKENALRYLKESGNRATIDPLAETIGALNSIVVTGDKLHGFNTDHSAILDSITTHLCIERSSLKDYRIAVIGAGGTGRTAVAALAQCGATVVIYNRTRDRATQLAAEFNGRAGKVVAADMGKLCDSCCQIYINTTSVGMHPNVDATPFGERTPKFDANTMVFDTVYNPMETRLLKEAKAGGAQTISGVEMFVRQAAGQFAAWTQQAAPIQVMRDVVAGKLNKAL